MIRFPWWRAAARFAWRDLRNSRASAALITFTMVVSTAGVGGVQSAAKVAREALHGDNRAWLGGDLAIDVRDPVSRRQAAALDQARVTGIQWTVITTGLTLAGSDQAPDPGLISVKAVDQAIYPFYGGLTLSPPQTLADSLREDTAVVSPEVLERLQVRVGDRILIAGQPFRISALIKDEPDRFSGSGALRVGMRCIISREGYKRSGMALSENSLKERVLLRLPDTSEAASTRRWLEGLFPGGDSRDYRNAYRQQSALTEEMLSFLSVTAFLGLALGTIGIGMAIRQHAEQSLGTLAVLKILGARSPLTASVFLLQVAWMMIAAFAIGVPLGFVTRSSILSLTAKYVVLPPSTSSYRDILFGAGVGLAALLPLLVRPMKMIRNFRPASVLRRAAIGALEPQAAERAGGSNWFDWIAWGAAYAVVLAFAQQMLRSVTSAALLAGAVAVTVGFASVLTSVALGLLGRWTSVSSKWLVPFLRHGVASLRRPGNRSHSLIVGLATAFTIMIATFETSAAVVRAVLDVLPYDRDALYVAGFRQSHRGRMQTFLQGQADIKAVTMLRQARLQLTSVDGVTLEQLRERAIPGVTIGSSYLAVCEDAPDQLGAGPGALTMANDIARQLGTKLGSAVEFQAQDSTIQTTVASIRPFTPSERIWSTLRLTCDGLNESALLQVAAIQMRPGRVLSTRAAIREQYPTLAVITAEEITETIASVSRDAMTLVRVVAWYTMGAGLCILMVVVAASRTARFREVGILSALGARRAFVIGVYTTEFATIGLLSGLVASLLTCGFGSVVLSVVFRRPQAAVDLRAIAGGILIPVLLTAAAGWLPVWGMLKRRPIEVLRSE